MPGNEVDAQLQGLLTGRRGTRGSTATSHPNARSGAVARSVGEKGPAEQRLAALVLVLLGACAGSARSPAALPRDASTQRTAAPVAATPTPVRQDPTPVAPTTAFGPEVLLPRATEGDTEVARVGDVVLKKSDAFTRLQTAHPKLALDAIDLLVFDVLVAKHAQEFGIRVDAARVEELAAAEEKQVRQQVASELGADVDLETYVWRLMGMPLRDWQSTLRIRTAQRLYQGYVIRYLALREDRVQVRFLVHKDKKVAQEVVDKVRAGADFATLALRWSEDPSRRDGGLLPAFGPGFKHPVAEVAFTLQRGEVSAPFEASFGDGKRWFAVYCLDRVPGRAVTFAAVRDEIDKDLADRPLSPLETNAYTIRWRGQSDVK